jgi:hypothetical protein
MHAALRRVRLGLRVHACQRDRARVVHHQRDLDGADLGVLHADEPLPEGCVCAAPQPRACAGLTARVRPGMVFSINPTPAKTQAMFAQAAMAVALVATPAAAAPSGAPAGAAGTVPSAAAVSGGSASAAADATAPVANAGSGVSSTGAAAAAATHSSAATPLVRGSAGMLAAAAVVAGLLL